MLIDFGHKQSFLKYCFEDKTVYDYYFTDKKNLLD